MGGGACDGVEGGRADGNFARKENPLRPQPTGRTSCELVANPGCQPGLATSCQQVANKCATFSGWQLVANLFDGLATC